MAQYENLLPCPFCGASNAGIEHRSKWIYGDGYDAERRTYSVRCRVCKARGPIASGKVPLASSKKPPTWAKTERELYDDAVKKWSRRIEEIEKEKSDQGYDEKEI